MIYTSYCGISFIVNYEYNRFIIDSYVVTKMCIVFYKKKYY